MGKKRATKNKKSNSRDDAFGVIMRGVFYGFFIPLLVVVSIFGFMYIKNKIDSSVEANNAQASMKEYLKSKYGQEFVVENYRIEGGGFAVEGYGVADAHREGSSYKFLVIKQKYSHNRYRDTYLMTLYNEQEDKSITRLAKKVGLKNAKYETDISISPDVADIIRGTPTLSDMLAKHGDNVIYGVRIVKTGSAPEEKDIKNLKILADYARAKNPRSYAARYVINSGTENSRYLCQLYGGTSKKNSQDPSIKCFRKYEGRE